MANPVLSTKLYPPPPRPDGVERPHLLQRLTEGLQQGRRLTLVSAPAGFGKTTLVSSWVQGSIRTARWHGCHSMAGKMTPINF